MYAPVKAVPENCWSVSVSFLNYKLVTKSMSLTELIGDTDRCDGSHPQQEPQRPSEDCIPLAGPLVASPVEEGVSLRAGLIPGLDGRKAGQGFDLLFQASPASHS